MGLQRRLGIGALHSNIGGRDAVDSHTIGSITGLTTRLEDAEKYLYPSYIISNLSFSSTLDNYAKMVALLATIGTDLATIIIDIPCLLGTNITFPSNVCLDIPITGRVKLATGIQATVNCELKAGLYRIFELVGTATLAGTPINGIIYPEWFGIDGVDDSIAINLALKLQGRIVLQRKDYKIANQLWIRSHTTLIGKKGTRVVCNADFSDVFIVQSGEGGVRYGYTNLGYNIEINKIAFVGNATTHPLLLDDTIDSKLTGLKTGWVKGVRIKDCTVTNVLNSIIHVSVSQDVEIDGNVLKDSIMQGLSSGDYNGNGISCTGGFSSISADTTYVDFTNWTDNKTYVTGDIIVSAGKNYKCTSGGASGAYTERPAHATGAVTYNSAAIEWTMLSTLPYTINRTFEINEYCYYRNKIFQAQGAGASGTIYPMIIPESVMTGVTLEFICFVEEDNIRITNNKIDNVTDVAISVCGHYGSSTDWLETAGVLVCNNVINGCHMGIGVEGTSITTSYTYNVKIYDNSIFNCVRSKINRTPNAYNYAILLDPYSMFCDVYNNNVYNTYRGISVTSSYNRVYDNKIYRASSIGISIGYSSTVLKHIECHNNVVQGLSTSLMGIRASKTDKVLITDNRVIGFPSGIVSYTENVHPCIKNNTVEESSTTGISVVMAYTDAITNLDITENRVLESGIGISVRFTGGTKTGLRLKLIGNVVDTVTATMTKGIEVSGVDLAGVICSGNDVKNATTLFVGVTNTWDVTHQVQMQGSNLPLDYYYTANTKLIDLCTNANFTSVVGTQSADSVNFKVGTEALKIAAPDATAQNLYSDHLSPVTTLNLAKFIDGSTSSTDDYVCWDIFIENIDAVDTVIKLALDNSTNLAGTNQADYVVLKASLATGWNHIKIQKSSFTSYGSFVWTSIQSLRVMWDVAAGNSGKYVTFNRISMKRKDPLSNLPNPYQKYVNGVWTRDMAIVSGTWYLGKENGEIISRNISPSASVNSLLGTKAYESFIAQVTMITKTANYCGGLTFYVDYNNYIVVYVNNSVLTATKVVAGTSTSYTTPMVIGVNDNVVIKTIKSKTDVRVSANVKGDKNNIYSLYLTFSPTAVGYLGFYSLADRYSNILNLTIGTTEHAHHADITETTKQNAVIYNAGEFTAETLPVNNYGIDTTNHRIYVKYPDGTIKYSELT